LQSEVHGILSLVGVTATVWLHCSLFSLKEPDARVVAGRGRCIECVSSPAVPPPERDTYGPPRPVADAAPEAGWTRKDDGVAVTFPMRKIASRRGLPRSFVTLCGSPEPAAAFPYARITPCISMRRNAYRAPDHGWLMTAEGPKTRGLSLRHPAGGASGNDGNGANSERSPPARLTTGVTLQFCCCFSDNLQAIKFVS